MIDLQIYTKLTSLKPQQKIEVLHFIELLVDKQTAPKTKLNKRVAGKAKGLIKMKDNFDDPIEGFELYS